MWKFFAQRWFLVTLVLLLIIGFAAGPRLEWLTRLDSLRNAILATVLFLMALPLEASTVWNTIRRPWSAILATAINFVLLPLVGWGLSLGFNESLAGGLLVAGATPCTLASASVWTRKAGGNDATATMVTVITNLICFVVTPAWLSWTLGKAFTASPDLAFRAMVGKLGLLVVLPMVAAQMLRLHRPTGAWSSKQKVLLTSLGQCGILYMVLQGAIQTGVRTASGQGMGGTTSMVVAMIFTVAALHTGMLWIGVKLGAMTGLPWEERIAVGFAGSQKTLMVGLKLSIDYGVSILPMVSYHILQLLIDTVIADYFADRRKREQVHADGKPT